MEENTYSEVTPEAEENSYLEVLPEPAGDYSEVPSGDTGVAAGPTDIPATPTVAEKKVYGPEDVGLVLAGGGGKGAYQIGALRALDEAGLLKQVAAVAGTSIGAINAVLYMEQDYEKAYKTWDDINMGVLFDFDPAMLAQGKLYFSREEMNRLMEQYVDYPRISGSDKEIYCGVAEELPGGGYRAEYMKLNGKSVGEIKNILMASTAMPIVYDTVLIGGRRYRDGGVVDNEPIRPLYDAGIRKFIVIGLTAGRVFSSASFPDAEFTVIDPTHDLGDIFTGTLNFYEDDKNIKRTLGYKDGKRAIKTHFEKDPNYIALAPALAAKDYEETVRDYERQKRVSALEQSVNSSFDYINELEKKYQW